MKKSLSVILSLVLLVSSLAIPMSVSAVSEINPEQLISGIKNAATNLQVKEDQKQQLFVPLGIFSNNSTYSGTKNNAITPDDDKKVVGSKVIEIPNEFGTNSNFWGIPAGTDAVVSYQPVSNTTDTSSYGAGISAADIKSVSFAVKTNKPISIILKIHSGSDGLKTASSLKNVSGDDEWQTLNWNISDDFSEDFSNIGAIFAVVNDENTNTKGFGEGANVYFGSMFFETTETDANVKEVTDVSGNDISDLADCIVKAEKIDTSVYTDDTVTVLKNAITDAKKALIAYYVQNDIDSLVSFVNNEIKILSKTEILLIGNIARYYRDGALDGTENAILVSSENTETNNGYTTNNYYPAADENWRYLSGNLALLAYVSPNVSVDDYKSNNFGDGFKTADYDEIYLYLVDNSFKKTKFSDGFLSQFGFLSGTSSWVNSSGNGDVNFSTTAILSGLDSGDYTKIFANKTKIPIKTNDNTYITGLYDDECIVKGLQINNNGLFTKDPNDGSEIAFSPLYGVKYCKEEVADQTSIAGVLTAVNSINVNDWDYGSIIEDTSKAIKEALLEDPSANLEDLRTILVSELEDAGTVEEVWYPKWVKNSTGFSSTENVYRPTEGATNDRIIDDNVANFGSYVAKLDSTHDILSITAGNSSAASAWDSTPINVDDYSDMWMYVYNNTENAVTPNQFIVVSTGSDTHSIANLSFPAKKLYRIEIDNVLKEANDAKASVNDWNTNRLQLKNQNLADNEAVYYGTVFGLRALDKTELSSADSLVKIVDFYDNYIKDKGLSNVENATETFEALKSRFASVNRVAFNDDTTVTCTGEYTLDNAIVGGDVSFTVDVKNGGSVTSVTYGGEEITANNDVYTITVDNAKTLEIKTTRDGYAPVGGMLTVDGGVQRDIIDHSTANNHPTWSQNKDTLNNKTETVVYQEPVLFYTDDGQVRSNVKLMYPVENIVAVTSYTTIDGEFVKYYKDEDFIVNDNGTISLTADSPIPHNIKLEEIKDRTVASVNWNTELPKNQVLVTYTYTKTWDDDVDTENDVDYEMPTYVNNLTTAYEKLNNKENLDVLFIGDSITTGCNTSGQDGTFYSYTADAVGSTTVFNGWSRYLGLSSKPYWVNDSWDKQVVANLEKAYPDATINWVNRAVASSHSQWYFNHIDELLVTGSLGDVNLANTDLVFIGFGMNERFESKDEHKERIENLINYLRNKNSNVSIVLVSAFYPTYWNSDNNTWDNYKLGDYEDLYFELAKDYKNIAVAPVNTAFTNILKAKEGVDYIANGVNHPNDYGVDLYANVISSTLVGSANIDAPYAMYLYSSEGKATYKEENDSTEKTAVYLFAQYKSPLKENSENALDPTKIILSDGNEGTVVSRTIYIATKTTAENLGDGFGKIANDKVKSSTVNNTDEKLAKCWASDAEKKLVTYGVKAKGITSVNKETPLAVRGKIVYEDASGVQHTIYSNVQTSEKFSAQGAYNVLKGSNPDLVWFTSN